MSVEPYAIHIAPRGGKIDLIVEEVAAARIEAIRKRKDYSRSKGGIGVYAGEVSVIGLLFKDEASIPDGWSLIPTRDDETRGVVAVPAKAKNHTKVARAAAKALKDEVASLPALPGAVLFTKKIGTTEVIAASDTGGFSLRGCFYHRIRGVTFVMTPWTTKADEAGENIDAKPPTTKTRIAFLPEGCERVGLSVFYAAQEKADAERKATP